MSRVWRDVRRLVTIVRVFRITRQACNPQHAIPSVVPSEDSFRTPGVTIPRVEAGEPAALASTCDGCNATVYHDPANIQAFEVDRFDVSISAAVQTRCAWIFFKT